MQNRKVLVVADRLYYIDRCVLQYFGVMDYVLKTNYPALSARAREAPSSGSLAAFLPQATKKTVAATYAFNAGETPEEVLFNINQYAWWNLPPGVTQAKYALLILLSSGHPAIELAKNLVWEQKPSVFIVRRLCIVWGWTLHRYHCSGD